MIILQQWWNSSTVEPLLRGHPFFTRKVAFQEGWPLVWDKNQYIYVKIYSVKWPFQRGWPLIRVASQKGFHCSTLLCNDILYYDNCNATDK